MNLKGPIYCFEYFYAKPGCKALLLDGLSRLLAPSRNESGCLQYDLLQDQQNENLIILIVKFSNPETLAAHEKQPYVCQFSNNELKKYCEQFTWNSAQEITLPLA